MCFAWAEVWWTRSTNNGCAELVTARHRTRSNHTYSLTIIIDNSVNPCANGGCFIEPAGLAPAVL